jgi:malate dehydrogenase (oxaloacetate-decarboxylating)(NADP+)
MLKLRSKLNTLLVQAATINMPETTANSLHTSCPNLIKNIAIDEKERLQRGSRSRSQIKGAELLRNPSLFKGMAFTIEERQLLGLQGLLPPAVLSQEIQSLRIMTNFKREQSDLDRYIDLINLQDR